MSSSIMIAAISSGSGKTTFSSGLLYLLKSRGVHAFKCGPDYIDPMFHKEVIGIPSTNLDSFFLDDNGLKRVFKDNAGEINIVEAAMGLYDGIGVSSQASAYDVAKKLGVSIVLLIDASGMGYSIVPLIKGFISEDSEGLIKGIVLNRISEKYYNRIASVITDETGIEVLGFIPKIKDAGLSSRHLGLLLPNENKFEEKIELIAAEIEKHVDIDGIIRLGNTENVCSECDSSKNISDEYGKLYRLEEELKIAIARDEAFTFFYEENIKFLEKIGAKITYFSPIRDEKIPDNCDVIILYGGYPENYAKKLSMNKSMLESIREAYERDVKIIAECGGFMYLLDSMNVNDIDYDLTKVLNGKSHRTNGLVRFGYVNVEHCDIENTSKKSITKNRYQIKAHEFHHFDIEGVEYSDVFNVRNEGTGLVYKGMIVNKKMIAGFPHLYYLSCPEFIVDFLKNELILE